MKLNYSGTRVLLLGGTCRLALKSSEAMISAGLRPTLCYRNDRGKARIETYLKGNAGKYNTLFLDLGAANDGLLIESFERGIDYLVDYAQEDLEGLVASVDPGAAHDFFDASVANRCAVIQQVIRKMVSRGKGRLVYLSSTAAGQSNPGQGFYAAAKCAMEALYRNIGIEMAGRGITTVSLRPGYVNAGRGRHFLEKRGKDELAKVPLGRALSTEEVTAAVLFLLSDEAVGFNAAELTMDGGLGAAK